MIAEIGRPAPETLRVADICAGLGGFHRALRLAERAVARRQVRFFPRERTFKCVFAAEMDEELRRLYVQNFPEIVREYAEGFPLDRVQGVAPMGDLYSEGELRRIHGDLQDYVEPGTDRLRCWPGTHEPIVPAHDLLCAGFPCQPFSKSGTQKGFADLKGTVFEMIRVIIAHHRPRYVLLENVGNFQRHDKGNTWSRVKEVLDGLGYSVSATTHVGGKDGGQGLLSPHHYGFPHHRERFFIVAQRRDLEGDFPDGVSPFPPTYRGRKDPLRSQAELEGQAEGSLRRLLSTGAVASPAEYEAAQLHPERVRCIEHWGRLLEKLRAHDAALTPEARCFDPLPSFPIWGYELDPWRHYPFRSNPGHLLANPAALQNARRDSLAALKAKPWYSPAWAPAAERESALRAVRPTAADADAWAAGWPAYARDREDWPAWKIRFIDQNRAWADLLWSQLDKTWLRSWLDELFLMPPSHQKLEWNCQRDQTDIWDHILQFRPSGLRVKRLQHVPALVAMTSTQIPVVPRLRHGEPASGASPGARGRHLLPTEALVLQGFPPGWHRPAARGAAFRAFGNAVHAELVAKIVLGWLFESPKQPSPRSERRCGTQPPLPLWGEDGTCAVAAT